MRKPEFLASLAVIALLSAAPAAIMSPLSVTAAQAQDVRVSFSVFFEDLQPHGVWVKHAKYKYVFCPRVDARWRPYTNGRWVYLKDHGWYFDSREPFAWAVYHYGRWVDDERIGWCWVPGRHWAPAWVSWRRSNDYVGWAPLRPEQDGFQVNITVNVGEPPQDDWVFVPVRSFIEPELEVNIIFADRDPDVFRQTEYVGPVVIQNNVVINNVIDIDFIQQQTNNEVKVVEAKEVYDPEAAVGVEGDATVAVFTPTIEEPAAEEAPPEAVEPEQAAEELGQPPSGETPATDQPATEQPAAGEAAHVDQETPAECPEGQQLVDGKCVPVAAEEQPAPVEEAAPAEEPAAPAEPAPAEEAAPAHQQAPAADDSATCPEGQQLVDGKCVTIAEDQPASTEERAPAEEQAAPAKDAPAEEAAPADEQSAPKEPPCPEGFQLIEGKCVPIEGEAAPQ